MVFMAGVHSPVLLNWGLKNGQYWGMEGYLHPYHEQLGEDPAQNIT